MYAIRTCYVFLHFNLNSSIWELQCAIFLIAFIMLFVFIIYSSNDTYYKTKSIEKQYRVTTIEFFSFKILFAQFFSFYPLMQNRYENKLKKRIDYTFLSVFFYFNQFNWLHSTRSTCCVVAPCAKSEYIFSLSQTNSAARSVEFIKHFACFIFSLFFSVFAFIFFPKFSNINRLTVRIAFVE